MRIAFIVAVAALTGGMVACFGSPESQQESSFNSRIQEFDGLIAKAQEPLKTELVGQKRDYLLKYGKLPAGGGRSDALGKLNAQARSTLNSAEARIKASAPAPAAGGGSTAGGPAAPSSGFAGTPIRSVALGKGLGEHMEILGPSTRFVPHQKICASVVISGRPKAGKVGARLMWRDDLVGETSLDLGDINRGLLFSFGENTYAGFNFTSEKGFWVGTRYHMDITWNGRKVGSYPFTVVPPAGAIPSKVDAAVLAKAWTPDYQPLDPSTVFGKGESVRLVVRGDFGKGSFVQADWFINKALHKQGTKSLLIYGNSPGVGLGFGYMPDGGWPPGQHDVLLTMDDIEIGRYPFTIIP